MVNGVRQNVGRRKCYICGLLHLATILNNLDRQVLSSTAEGVISEFHTDNEGFGAILASFRYFYAVQFAGGWIVDAYGARLVFPAAVAFLSFASICSIFSPRLRALMICSFLRGVGEAFNWPCALNVTERLIEPKDRPLANGIFQQRYGHGCARCSLHHHPADHPDGAAVGLRLLRRAGLDVEFFSEEVFLHEDVWAFASYAIAAFGAKRLLAASDYPLMDKSRYLDDVRLARPWIGEVWSDWSDPNALRA